MSPKKKVAAIVALTLVAALLLGGAFAWHDFSQAAWNILRGRVTPDVLLHDDFTPGENKDVYVENIGEPDVYVRIQFGEYLQIGNTTIVGNNLGFNKPGDYPVHLYEGQIFDTTNLSHAIDWDIAATSANTAKTSDYFYWDMSGAQKVYQPGTADIADVDYDAIGSGNMAPFNSNGQLLADTAAPAGVVKLSTLFPSGSLLSSLMATAKANTRGYIVANGYDVSGATNYKQIFQIYLNQLLAPYISTALAALPSTGCWVIDDTPGGNGWAYWSVPLKQGEATNLLLDNVQVKGKGKYGGISLQDNYVYAIDVRLEATNKTELYEFNYDMTDTAKLLWADPSTTIVDIPGARVFNPDAAWTFGGWAFDADGFMDFKNESVSTVNYRSAQIYLADAFDPAGPFGNVAAPYAGIPVPRPDGYTVSFDLLIDDLPTADLKLQLGFRGLDLPIPSGYNFLCESILNIDTFGNISSRDRAMGKILPNVPLTITALVRPAGTAMNANLQLTWSASNGSSSRLVNGANLTTGFTSINGSSVLGPIARNALPQSFLITSAAPFNVQIKDFTVTLN